MDHRTNLQGKTRFEVNLNGIVLTLLPFIDIAVEAAPKNDATKTRNQRMKKSRRRNAADQRIVSVMNARKIAHDRVIAKNPRKSVRRSHGETKADHGTRKEDATTINDVTLTTSDVTGSSGLNEVQTGSRESAAKHQRKGEFT